MRYYNYMTRSESLTRTKTSASLNADLASRLGQKYQVSLELPARVRWSGNQYHPGSNSSNVLTSANYKKQPLQIAAL